MCRRKSVTYFAHDPAHRLVPQSGDGNDSDDEGGSKFTCDGCLVAGAGRRYRCGHPGCGFTIHEACAPRGFPRKLRSAVHPEHRLRRSAAGPADDGGNSAGCEVCGEVVKGARYVCTAGPCGGGVVVAVHPLCAWMPGSARGPAHEHEAWLVRVSPPPAPTPLPDDDDVGDGGNNNKQQRQQEQKAVACAACGRPVGAWRYRCVTCRAELHPRCLVPATDQCRAGGAGGEGRKQQLESSTLARRCCCGLLHDVTRCLATSGTALHYRGYYNGQ